MLYRGIIAVCSEIHTKHINTLCGQNVGLLNVKPGGTCSDHRALKGLIPSLSLQQYFGFTLLTSKPDWSEVWPNSVVVTYSKTCRAAVAKFARQRAAAIVIDRAVMKRNIITWGATVGLACRTGCYVRVAVGREIGGWANLTFMWPCIVINFL